MKGEIKSIHALRSIDDRSTLTTEPLSLIEVALIGYGNQGRAHALNLRDSGVRVIVGARSGGPGHAAAKADGFNPVSLSAAVERSGLVVVALPDHAHQSCWNSDIAPHLRADAVVGFLHGFSVHHGAVRAEEKRGVVMVAPKGPGKTLRDRFVQGLGIPALFAVHQGGSDAARTRAIGLGWATGIGSARARVIETTFAAECETDLFGEQAVLCGGMLGLVQAAFETLVEAGYPAELAYMECCQELKQIADLVFERGPAGMREAISSTAEFGAFEASDELVDAAWRTKLRGMLQRIRDGRFGHAFQADAAAGFPRMRERRAAAAHHPIEAAGRAVRDWMPWIEGRKDER